MKYKQNLISLLPYGKADCKTKARRDKKGHVIVQVKDGKKVKKFMFNEEAGVVF